MKNFTILAILFAALVAADSFRPVSKVMTPPEFDFDGTIWS